MSASPWSELVTIFVTEAQRALYLVAIKMTKRLSFIRIEVSVLLSINKLVTIAVSLDVPGRGGGKMGRHHLYRILTVMFKKLAPSLPGEGFIETGAGYKVRISTLQYVMH